MTIFAPIKQHIEALVSTSGYPGGAIKACLTRPAESVPLLRALLQRAARGQKLGAGEADQLFLGVHILAQLRDAQSFPALLRLLRRPSHEIDDLFGDAVTESLNKVAAGLYDGDADALFEAIGDGGSDEYVRDALWRTAAALTFEGRIERARMRDELERFGDGDLAPQGDTAWLGWLGAIGHLGFDDLVAAHDASWIERRLPDDVITRQDFDDDLAAALRAPDDPVRMNKASIGSLDDVADALRWVDWNGRQMPVVNLMRNVGRNDPCPCGSGKKAKKCCLASA